MSVKNGLSVTKKVISSKAGRAGLKLSKNSPHLLFGAGVVGVVATAVMASKATLKLEEIADQAEKNRDAAGRMLEAQRDDYSATDYTKDLAIIKTRMVKDVVRAYAPAVAVGSLSVLCLTGSHIILTNRNTQLMAAYAALDKSYSEYRKRVIEKYGVDEEKKLRSQVNEKQTVSEDGVIDIDFENEASPYAVVFNQRSSSYSPNLESNAFFVRAQQQYMNDLLHSRGHVFLNEAYDALGLPRTRAGAVVGWVRGEGDNRVDFGLDDYENQIMPRGLTARHGIIFLDFNVDGVIWDKI